MSVGGQKALTRVNLPFIGDRGNGKTYEPGEMIPAEDFEDYIDWATRLIEDRTHKDENASPVPTVQSEIKRLTEWGSISDDPDAELHPSAVIPDPNTLTITSLIAQAQALVEQLENDGKEIPAELRTLAESDNQVTTNEIVTGVDHHA